MDIIKNIILLFKPKHLDVMYWENTNPFYSSDKEFIKVVEYKFYKGTKVYLKNETNISLKHLKKYYEYINDRLSVLVPSQKTFENKLYFKNKVKS